MMSTMTVHFLAVAAVLGGVGYPSSRASRPSGGDPHRREGGRPLWIQWDAHHCGLDGGPSMLAAAAPLPMTMDGTPGRPPPGPSGQPEGIHAMGVVDASHGHSAAPNQAKQGRARSPEVRGGGGPGFWSTTPTSNSPIPLFSPNLSVLRPPVHLNPPVGNGRTARTGRSHLTFSPPLGRGEAQSGTITPIWWRNLAHGGAFGPAGAPLTLSNTVMRTPERPPPGLAPQSEGAHNTSTPKPGEGPSRDHPVPAETGQTGANSDDPADADADDDADSITATLIAVAWALAAEATASSRGAASTVRPRRKPGPPRRAEGAAIAASLGSNVGTDHWAGPRWRPTRVVPSSSPRLEVDLKSGDPSEGLTRPVNTTHGDLLAPEVSEDAPARGAHLRAGTRAGAHSHTEDEHEDWGAPNTDAADPPEPIKEAIRRGLDLWRKHAPELEAERDRQRCQRQQARAARLPQSLSTRSSAGVALNEQGKDLGGADSPTPESHYWAGLPPPEDGWQWCTAGPHGMRFSVVAGVPARIGVGMRVTTLQELRYCGRTVPQGREGTVTRTLTGSLRSLSPNPRSTCG